MEQQENHLSPPRIIVVDSSPTHATLSSPAKPGPRKTLPGKISTSNAGAAAPFKAAATFKCKFRLSLKNREQYI